MGRDWRKKKSSLGGSLGHIFDTGLYSDVAFLVGEEEVRIKAHKTILSARSEPLAAMFERWTSAGTGEIKMPKNNPAAVKLFLRFLYTDDMVTFFFGNMGGKTLGIDDILEITHLAHMYQVHQLLEQCIARLTNNINEQNCLLIHKSCELLDKTLSDKALQFFLRNIVPKATSTDDYLTWDYDIIEKILKDDREYVPEAILFKALLKWRNVDSARNEAFQKLTKLIRFSTISVKDFASEVVTSGVLSNEEKLEVFSYIATQSGSKRKKLLVTIAAIGDPTRLKICGSPSVLDNYTFKRLVGTYGGNFHKFKLTFKDRPGHSKKTGTGTNDIKLYGVKVFNSDGNTDLMAFLQRKRFKINVTLTSDGSGISKVIEKTILELNQFQMRAYLDSPLVISQSESYYITTNLTPGLGKYHSSDAIPFELPQLLWPYHRQPDLDWDGGKVEINCFETEGSYSFIEELLFSPPDASDVSEGSGDCKIS